MCDADSVLVIQCKVEAELHTMCGIFSLMLFIPLCRDISVLLNVIYGSVMLSNTVQCMLH